MSTVYPKLPAHDAFMHVVYDYRYLTKAGKAWNIIGKNGYAETVRSANEIIPGIGVLVQDSLLLHARSLIDFFTKDATTSQNTDIILSDFGLLPISQRLKDKLKDKYKNAVEVHTLHLTAWRDARYRATYNSSDYETKRARPNWNTHNSKIVDTLLKALEEVSNQSGPWQPVFQELHEASRNQLANKDFSWPKHLGNKPNVERFLGRNGL